MFRQSTHTNNSSFVEPWQQQNKTLGKIFPAPRNLESNRQCSSGTECQQWGKIEFCYKVLERIYKYTQLLYFEKQIYWTCRNKAKTFEGRSENTSKGGQQGRKEKQDRKKKQAKRVKEKNETTDKDMRKYFKVKKARMRNLNLTWVVREKTDLYLKDTISNIVS